jgi:AcrR family transcriptional regulator
MESGITQTGLLHHFPSKDSLLHAALDVRDRTDEYPFRASQWDGSVVFDHVASIVLSWSEHPDIVGMFTALLVENLGEDAPLHSRLLTRYADLRQVIADGLSSAQERGELRRDFEADQKAVEIIAFLNGLETSWLLNPEIPAAAVALSWAAEQKAQLSAGRPAGRRRG